MRARSFSTRKGAPVALSLSPSALDQKTRPIETDLDRAADALIDRSDVDCPSCDGTDATQFPVYVGRDGALTRADYLCGACGLEYPIWVE